MYTNRMRYIIFYQGKQVIEKLQTLPVDIHFISEKQGYVVFYTDMENEANIKKQIRNVKGFKFMGDSQTFDPNLNF
jgi:uncharacterized protein YlbG (UPF0298 family)